MGVSLEKQWSGESGYCNCLLVVMSRGPIPLIDLVEDQPPPNLEALIASKSRTASWIRAQELDYSALRTASIIRILAKSAGITRSRLSGAIIAHDCVEDDGPMIERTFHFRLTRTSGVIRLAVELET